MIIHGNNLIVSVGGTAVAAAKSCELNVAADTIEVASPNIGDWRSFIVGRKTWNVSVGYLLTPLYVTYRPTLVGESVILTFTVRQPGDTLNFAGFDTPASVQLRATGAVDSVWWHPTMHMFIGKVGSTYYQQWPSKEADGYATPSQANSYHCAADSKDYIYDGLQLVVNAMLRGAAIVTGVKMTGTRGNLATGSVTFKGSGALTRIE